MGFRKTWSERKILPQINDIKYQLIEKKSKKTKSPLKNKLEKNIKVKDNKEEVKECSFNNRTRFSKKHDRGKS